MAITVDIPHETTICEARDSCANSSAIPSVWWSALSSWRAELLKLAVFNGSHVEHWFNQTLYIVIYRRYVWDITGKRTSVKWLFLLFSYINPIQSKNWQECKGKATRNNTFFRIFFTNPILGENKSGWWLTNPSEKYDFVSSDDDILICYGNKTCSKPPTSYYLGI
jgi:hypothetical protein